MGSDACRGLHSLFTILFDHLPCMSLKLLHYSVCCSKVELKVLPHNLSQTVCAKLSFFCLPFSLFRLLHCMEGLRMSYQSMGKVCYEWISDLQYQFLKQLLMHHIILFCMLGFYSTHTQTIKTFPIVLKMGNLNDFIDGCLETLPDPQPTHQHSSIISDVYYLLADECLKSGDNQLS